jgi:hypothetical protein
MRAGMTASMAAVRRVPGTLSSRRTVRVALLVALVALVAAVYLPGAPRAARADNTHTTLVLHAIATAPSNDCFTPQDQGFDCSTFAPASVSVPPSSEIDVYLYVRNHDDLVGVQCAFAWGAEWAFRQWAPGSMGGCQSQQLYGTTPAPPGGATAGTLAAVFDCVTGGFLTPIGRLQMGSGTAGCLSIIESQLPFGTHVVGCDLRPTPVAATGRGRVCVGAGGLDTCAPVNPVGTTTWGRIKASYIER